jgi:fatty-acyl-CoA synthase
MNGLRYPGTIAAQDPERVAITMAGSGEAVTFGALDAAANRLARTFRVLGLRNRDHVAISMENRVEFVEVAWGAHYAGLHYTFFSTRLLPDEAAHIVNDSGSSAVVVSSGIAEQLLPGLRARVDPQVRFLSVDGGTEGAEPIFELASASRGDPIPGALEGSDMLYTSGTTGRPRGVLRPFSGLPLGSTLTIGLLGEMLLGMGPGSIYLSPAPMYHAAPLRWVMDTMALGGSIVAMEHFDAEQVLAAIERYRVTHAQFVPTMFTRMLKLPADVRQKYDLSSLRAVVHAAAPCPVDIKKAMFDWWGPIIHEYYAGTEANGLCWCGPEDWLAHPGTVGRALVGQVHVVGDEGEELGPGEEGAIYFGGGPAFEYHNDPAKTAEAHTRHGWSTMGDIGRLDEEGFLYLTDRKSDVVISGGVNVYPQEAENVLAGHPAVLDVAVFGIPDDDFGEEILAVVSLVDPLAASDALGTELIEYCRDRLAGVKCPRAVEFRQELPRTPSGKLVKRLLRDEYWKGHSRRI